MMGIKGRLIITVTTSLALVLNVFGVNTTAAHTVASTNGNSTDNPIRSGLWAGANLTTDLLSNGNDEPSASDNNTPRNGRVYAALGDSVAAGLGLPVPAGADAQDRTCGRSSLAYPNKVAARTNMTLIHAACSGAKAGDLFTEQGISGQNNPPQLNTAFAQGTPELITITVGANDIYWVTFLRKCYTTTCGTSTDSALIRTYLSVLRAKLYYAFNDIEQRSGGSPPKVLLTGYYNPLSSRCTQAQSRITAGEIAWMDAQTNALNQALQDVSSNFSYARFVPIDFTGHDICSSDSWVQGPNDTAPFHPTARGQEAIADAVLNTL